ncbi:MAG: hypothetical protein JSR61_19220 [Proteobacteria bacterium]|nr:hypothetical protein [Pseudomonadota bacterium]
MTVKVEIDVFSGRSNPSWILSQDEQRRLVGLLDLETHRQVPGASNDGLGFRGFIIHVGDREIHVRGTIVLKDGASFLDRSKSVEKFLLETMPEELRREFSDLIH